MHSQLTTLEAQIQKARQEIVSDGYDMSIGEIINLYRDKELIINPEFQRLFRWDNTRKARFIESLLLGIPIPPIFVFQTQEGNWELIDGLQRISTILEFVGVLEGKSPSQLERTSFLPALEGKMWECSSDVEQNIGKQLQLQIKRARIRVEILLKESDNSAKYELFQRLNTGGAQLSEQEVRSCIAVMVNPTFHSRILQLVDNEFFKTTTNLSQASLDKQFNVELVLRFFAFRNYEYERSWDVHEYLDKALLHMATSEDIDWKKEQRVFEATFQFLYETLGEDAFKQWSDKGNKFGGKFLVSLYEAIGFGLSENIGFYSQLSLAERKEVISCKAKNMAKQEVFAKYTGSGNSGRARLTNILPFAKDFFGDAHCG